MSSQQLTDKFGRVHDYLRISLTDACNLRCTYCMPDEKVKVTPSSRMMQKDEIIRLAELFVAQGVKKIRLTGGEPLVRKDARDIILALAQLPVSLSITSNGVLIDEYIDVLVESGIENVNISLDTLDAQLFFEITKRGDYERIRKNIELLLSNAIPVKVNVVVMKGVNEQDILPFVEWTQDHPIDVRFIEFMPFLGNAWNKDKVVPKQEMLDLIAEQHSFEKLADTFNSTSKNYRICEAKGTFGFITTVSEPFCDGCNRLRLTADGKMKNCLFSDGEMDVLTPLRNGEDILPLLHENVQAKKEKLGGRVELNEDRNRSMIKIGG